MYWSVNDYLSNETQRAEDWLRDIKASQAIRTAQQKLLASGATAELEGARDRAKAWLDKYRGITLDSVTEDQIKKLKADGEAFSCSGCLSDICVVRIPIALTPAGQFLTEAQLYQAWFNDARVWVALESKPFGQKIVEVPDLTVYGAGKKLVTNYEYPPISTLAGSTEYHVWANYFDDKQKNVDKICSELAASKKAAATAQAFGLLAGSLQFALEVIPFGGAVSQIFLEDDAWSTEDTINLVLDAALTLTGVGLALKGSAQACKTSGKAATTAIKWGVRIQRTAHAIEVGTAAFQGFDASYDLITANNSGEAIDASARLIESLFILGSEVRSVAKARSRKILAAKGTGSKTKALGEIPEAAEKGAKANLCDPDSCALSAADIACLPQCFPAGTLVETQLGHKPIEDVAAGDHVWGRDEATGRWTLAEVITSFHRIHDGAVATVRLSNGDTFTATGAHPVWVTDGEELSDRPVLEHCPGFPGTPVEGRWVQAGDLQTGDRLAARHDDNVFVEDVNVEHREIEVFNLQIARVATYTVAPCGVWVHNQSGKKGKKLCPELPTGTPAGAKGNAPKEVLKSQSAQETLLKNQQRQLQEAIEQGGKNAKGKVLDQQGRLVQDLTNDTLDAIPGATRRGDVSIGTGVGSEIDNVVTRGSKTAFVESKLTVTAQKPLGIDLYSEGGFGVIYGA